MHVVFCHVLCVILQKNNYQGAIIAFLYVLAYNTVCMIPVGVMVFILTCTVCEKCIIVREVFG